MGGYTETRKTKALSEVKFTVGALYCFQFVRNKNLCILSLIYSLFGISLDPLGVSESVTYRYQTQIADEVLQRQNFCRCIWGGKIDSWN
jgi:hypothetical protein